MNVRDAIAPLVPGLRRYAHALCGVRDVAARAPDDLVQQSLRRALNDERLKRGADVRRTLYALVTTLNRIRSREGELQQHDHAAMPAGSAKSFFGDAPAGTSIERGLSGLPLEQREVLLLVVLERMRYDEVAEILEVPVATALARLTRARDALRIAFNGSQRSAPAAQRGAASRAASYLRVVK